MTEEELVEEAARALAAENMGMADGSRLPDDLWQQAIPAARTVLAAVEPKIRADERERAARIAEDYWRCLACGGLFHSYHASEDCPSNYASLRGISRDEIAAAIRDENYGRNPPR